jgi:PHD/YefM family antitoxin component YafN of YafNO toxin-antitoxin module
MKVYSTTELARNVADVTRAATQEPVALAQHRKARFVMLNVDLYQEVVDALGTSPLAGPALKRLREELPPLPKDLRQAMFVNDMPVDLARDARAAIKAYQESDES